jgi:tRNA(fMet)-specific endonuclease VapC
MHRFIQHGGQLHIPTIVLGELYVWAYRRSDPDPVVKRIEDDPLPDVTVLDFDSNCAKCFGNIRGESLTRGYSQSRLDLMIACVALVHDLTLVTHNTRDYLNIPGLRLDDWLTS